MQQTHRERVSTRQSLENTIFRRELSGRAFGNDPDVFFLRTDNLNLTEEQKDILSRINTLLGDVWMTSDDMGKYSPEAERKYRELRRLREAENVRVSAGDWGIRIDYTLNGEKQTLQTDLKRLQAASSNHFGRRK